MTANLENSAVATGLEKINFHSNPKERQCQIDILGISKLKWTRMGEFTQKTIISTTVGKNPLEEME